MKKKKKTTQSYPRPYFKGHICVSFVIDVIFPLFGFNNQKGI